jgi:hypothetical protein
MLWTEKKIMEIYQSGNYDADNLPDFVKDTLSEIEAIANSNEYDNVKYITEILRDEYVGQLVTINGRTYAATEKGRPIGKIVGAIVTDENGNRYFGIGCSKIHPTEKCNINLIGNHVAFMRAKQNALSGKPPFDDIVLTAEERLQVEHFFLRCYKYFRMEGEKYEKEYNRIFESKKKRLAILNDKLKWW